MGSSLVAGGLHVLEAKVKRPNGVIESANASFMVASAAAAPSQAPSPLAEPSPSVESDPTEPGPTREPPPATSEDPAPTVSSTSTTPPGPDKESSSCDGAVLASASLEQVTESAGPATTFCLDAGVFRVPNGVTLQDGDVLQGAGRSSTFVEGTGALHVLKAVSGARVMVRSLDISCGVGDGTCRPACGRAVFGNGSAWTLEDLRCHHNDNQCVGGGSAAITMRDSECDHNGGGLAFNSDGTTRSAACIKRASTGAGRLLVTGSHIHDNLWAGVWCDYCTEGPFIVENNVITDNVSKGVSYEVSGGWSSTDQAVIRNNTIERNGLGDSRTVAAGITCNSCGELTIVGNRFGGNAGGRAIGFVNADRGGWGDLYAIEVSGNQLGGDTVNCSMVGVSCSSNA